ncbi:hypothetical protein Sjap_011066 [Stephania japonica]|uniref:DUF4216 domain-containing protein n=1 Tax=Stephania japonica TaxID=461633 RepID=A0AAP0JAV3_9MAGN
MKFVLFKGDWVNSRGGEIEDEFKFKMVNFKHLLYKDNKISDEPFILATQAEQVCYVQDPLSPDWHVVLKLTSRDLFDMYSADSTHVPIMVPQVELYAQQQLDETTYLHDDDFGWVREGVDGATVEANEVTNDNENHDINIEEFD